MWLDLRDSKKFENLFLAKLKTAITFAPGIRSTIIIYVFGVEKYFPYCGNPSNPAELGSSNPAELG